MGGKREEGEGGNSERVGVCVGGQMNLAPGSLKGHAASTRDGDMQSYTCRNDANKLLERISGQDTVFHWINEGKGHKKRDGKDRSLTYLKSGKKMALNIYFRAL